MSSSSQPLPHHDERIPTTPNVQLPPGISSPPASDVDCPASVLSTALCDFVPTMRSHRIVRTTATGVTPGAPISLASPAGAPLSFLLFNDCEPTPEFLYGSPRRSPGPALKSDQPSQRQTEKLQVLSWNPGRARGSGPTLLASHLDCPWQVNCVQEGSGFVTDNSLAENFCVATQHHCAVLLNKDTFTRDISCTSFLVQCSLRCSAWAVEGMVVTGKFRRTPDQSCSYFTVANVHMNNESAKWRSVCIALLLLIRDLCIKLGAVIPTGDFNKAVNVRSLRWKPPSATPTFHGLLLVSLGCGVPGGELHGHEWPDCCGFMVLPESQSQWLILRHGSVNVVLADIGVRATEKTWHLKFAERKRRRDSMSRQKIVLHTNK